MTEQKVFVCGDEEFAREFKRERAKGHKTFEISPDVSVFDAIQLKTNGDSLVMCKADEEAGDNPEYSILCKEFGMVCPSASKRFDNDISVILLDGGWMLVTLKKGAIVINMNGRLMMPSRNVESLPKVVEEDIFWANIENILGVSKYWHGSVSVFPFDYEIALTVSGSMIGGLSTFHIKPHLDEHIDLSLGYIAQWEQKQALKAQAKEAKNVAKLFTPSASTALEFDDDDDYEDDEDNDEDDDWDEDDDF